MAQAISSLVQEQAVKQRHSVQDESMQSTVSEQRQMDSTVQDQSQTTSDEGIEYIWQAMTARYGSKWSGQWVTEKQIATAKQMWAIDVGKTSRKAVEKAFWKSKDTHPVWPPTSAEFGLLCRGAFSAALGIPEFDKVFADLMNPYWVGTLKTHEIYWGILHLANENTPVSVLRMWSAKRAEAALKRVYDECKRAMVFGIKYEPPKHLLEVEKKQLAAPVDEKTKEANDKAYRHNMLHIKLKLGMVSDEGLSVNEVSGFKDGVA